MRAHISPLARVALVLLTGTSVGLLAASRIPVEIGPGPVWGLALGCVGLGWPAARWSARVLPPVLTCVGLLGAAAGVVAGQTSLAGCTAQLDAGTSLLAIGWLGERLEPAPEGRPSIRTELHGTVLLAQGRWCTTPRVRLFVDPSGPLEAGHRVVARGVWRRIDEASHPRRPHAYGWIQAGSVQSSGAGSEGRGFAPFRRWRGELAARLEGSMPTTHAAVAKALVLADRSTLDRPIRETFARAGIVHLLAISGMHVGLVAGWATWLVGLRVRGRRRFLWAAALTVSYVGFVGAPPSAVRAASMLALYAVAAWRERPARVGDVVGLAMIGALISDPLLATDPGFQLSYAGLLGVIAGARCPLPTRWPRFMPGPLGRALLVSCGAFVCTAPIAAWHFERIVVSSIPASVVAAPIVVLALPAVVLTLALPEPASAVFAGAATVLVGALIAVADTFAALPLRASSPGLAGVVAGAVASLAMLVLDRFGRRRGVGVLAAGLLGSAWLGAPQIRAHAERGTALVCSLDVGQGDAAVVRTGKGRWLVFDAGPGADFRRLDDGDARTGWGDAGRRHVVPFLRRHGTTAIELFALSHPHIDHFGGAAAVLDAFDVRTVLDPGYSEPSVAYERFLRRVRAEGAAWRVARAGERFTIDDIALEVLWPHGPQDDANAGSLVFRLSVHDFDYLNTGDAPVETEHAILARVSAERLETDVAKVGHHGSRTSTSLEWLRATRPSIALISAGRDNRYGHPHPATLARLDSARVSRVWRTDRDGTLCVAVDREGWRVVS